MASWTCRTTSIVAVHEKPKATGGHILIKTLLNRVHPLQSFVYGKVSFVKDGVEVSIAPRKKSRPLCSGCGVAGTTYDTSREPREFEFVPVWNLSVVFLYAMRRVDCQSCGPTTERVPWADGKHRSCNVYRLFLATWAKRMSWTEVGRIFNTDWGVVYRAVGWVVAYGLRHQDLDSIRSIGVDEIAVWKGHKYLTVVYQIDRGMRRLLWIGRDRTEASFAKFFVHLGPVRSNALAFVVSDMWRPYLKVIAARAAQATHVLDRYHVVAKLNKAIDEVRSKEAKEMQAKGYEPVLKKSRWAFLKRKENLTPCQSDKLTDVLQYNLKTVRAYHLKESFEAFWVYHSPTWASWFLDAWCAHAMRSGLVPFKKFAKTMRNHKPLLLNWFRAKKEISGGAVEGQNLNAKLAIRKARGFRTYEVLEIALYHQLGKLPEPDLGHRFC